MGVAYLAVATCFLPFWKILGCRPILILPFMFLAQLSYLNTPWLILWVSLAWDSFAYWPLGLSGLFYLISSFTWLLWQRWVMDSYMTWVVFALWSLVVHGGAWLALSWIQDSTFPYSILMDLVVTVCLFPLCVKLWPFGRNH